MTDNATLGAAYAHCRKITENHYENFPVASFLLPRRLRSAVAAIYAFSRSADDFADEAIFDGSRLEKLDDWGKQLRDKKADHPIFIALHDAMSHHDLPEPLFEDLLTAFRQDVTQTRYQDFTQVLRYCRYSANPVGRLLLHLFKHDDEENLKQSDALCTALQLANFWQDIAIDWKKNRIYLPQNEMAEYGVTENDLQHEWVTPAFTHLLKKQIERTRNLFGQGHALGLSLSGRLGVEIRLTWLSGFRLLEKIEDIGYDVFRKRPTLSRWDFIALLPYALSKKLYAQQAPVIHPPHQQPILS